MKAPFVFSGLMFGMGLSQTNSSRGTWEPPRKTDQRGPCPGLNTLANHNYLPHDGNLLTEEVVSNALFDAFNFDHPFGAFLWSLGIPVNPEPNATYFTLDQLKSHNLIEHDASLSAAEPEVLVLSRDLSRADAYFGNHYVFNQTIFDKSRQYWTEPTLTAEMLANSKLAREIESRAFNPTYSYPNRTNEASLLELAAPIAAFGDPDSGTLRRDFLEYFFENERLPTELGWVAREKELTKDDMMHVSELIRDATDLITPDEDESGTGNGNHAASPAVGGS